jgi:hypothetical protein
VTAASDSNRNRAGDEQGKEVAAEQLGKSVFIDDRLAPAIDREFKEIVAEESSRAKKA